MGTNAEIVIGPKGCASCLGFVLVLILFWALIFGVNVGGKHYGIASCDGKGVNLEAGDK